MDTVDTLKSRIGSNVRRYRKKIGFSQEVLAEKIGMTETSVGLLERGVVWPEYETLTEICGALGIHELSLLEGTPVSARPPNTSEALEIISQALKEPRLSAVPFSDPFADLDEIDRSKALRFIDTLPSKKKLDSVKSAKGDT